MESLPKELERDRSSNILTEVADVERPVTKRPESAPVISTPNVVNVNQPIVKIGRLLTLHNACLGNVCLPECTARINPMGFLPSVGSTNRMAGLRDD
jgi:hypothetical protein